MLPPSSTVHNSDNLLKFSAEEKIKVYFPSVVVTALSVLILVSSELLTYLWWPVIGVQLSSFIPFLY